MRIPKLKDLFRGQDMRSRTWVFFRRGHLDRQERIERELQVRQRAEDDGRNNLPPSSATDLTAIEQHVVNRFDADADATKQGLWRRLRGALELIVAKIPAVLAVEPTVEATKLAIVQIKDRKRARLIAARKHERDCLRNLDRFRSANRLTGRTASYSLPWPLKTVFWVLFGVVLDGVINAGFYAERSSDYIAGGVIQAFAFGAVMALLGFGLLGLITSRYATHLTRWKRYAGIGGTFFAILAGLLAAGYIAHYREMLQRVPLDRIDALAGDSYVDAAKHLREHPFDLTSWQAMVLFVISGAIFVVMAYKGHTSDDSYPRFGHVTRVHKAALCAYETEKASVKRACEKEIDKTQRALSRRIEHEARQVEEAREILGESEAAGREAADSAADLVRACTGALRTYRESNTFVRTIPPPTYFKDYPQFTVELPELEAVGVRFKEAVDALENNRRAKIEIEKQIHEISKAEVEAFLAFIDDIEREEARLANDNVHREAAE